MIRQFLLPFSLFLLCHSHAQYQYEPSAEHPYGLPNPEAPEQLLDFAPLIGECNCLSETRKADKSWTEPVSMTWKFKYIMNGMAIQDETLKEDGRHSGSIRQFNADSLRWYVHYYSSASAPSTLTSWSGTRNKAGDIILYSPQKAPNGTEGFYKITFYDINQEGFQWSGEWVSTDESFSYPTWKIHCTRSKPAGTSNREQIESLTKAFSKAYLSGDYETLTNTYAPDAKIFPNNSPIIEGGDAIRRQWATPQGAEVLDHRVAPISITILGDYAYDYGYYQGTSKNADGEVSEWKGKYVIIWKKINGQWKIYLDIWNRVP